MTTKTVNIIHKRHANLDSFPLRYGFSFSSDSTLKLTYSDSSLKPDKTFKDRYNLIAEFKNPENNKLETGRFYLLNQHKNHSVSHDEVVTVIRTTGDTQTEHHLSAVIRSLRESGDINVAELIELHPLYIKGNIKKHGDLIKILVEKKSSDEILRIQNIVDNSVEKYDELKLENEQLMKDNRRLEEELDEYRKQEQIANTQGSTQTLEREKLLDKVNIEVNHRGSSCTELLMGDGTRLYMKTITFDRDLSITAKAKSLEGKKVKTSCWDPISEPGKWSKQGYFRNVYELSDEDLE
ncbi:cell division protein ZapB [Candidatus Thioglobus sp.]|nr:cell division protein ZapB [Candidatus Thioglobus sp.]